MGSIAYGQEETKYFYTRQECGPALVLLQNIVDNYNEEALFTGSNVSFGVDGMPYQGAGLFLVNQDTGTWSMLTMYGDGTACLTALGTEFEPYVD
jgi:hypothetical protein